MLTLLSILNLSRRKIYRSEKLIRENRDRKVSELLSGVSQVCSSTEVNLEFLKKNKKMKSRTLLLRYEDMATKPEYYAKVKCSR